MTNVTTSVTKQVLHDTCHIYKKKFDWGQKIGKGVAAQLWSKVELLVINRHLSPG